MLRLHQLQLCLFLQKEIMEKLMLADKRVLEVLVDNGYTISVYA